MIERVETGIAPSSAPINDAVRAGKHLWLVAIAEDPVTREIVEGGIEAQARRCIQNLEIALKAASGTLRNLVMVQIFLVDSADAGIRRTSPCLRRPLRRRRDCCEAGETAGRSRICS